MKRVLNFIDTWLFECFADVPAKGVSAFRVVFCFYLLIIGMKSYAKEIASLNPELYDPRSSLAIFFDLPGNSFFVGLDYLILILIILVFVGYKTNWTSLLLGICILIGNSFIYSFGKISHGWLLVLLVPIIFSFSNWGAYYSLDSKIEPQKEVKYWPITVFAMLIGIAMISAGLEKVFHGWLLWDYDAVRYTFYRGIVYEKTAPLAEWVLAIQSKFFWEFADYSIVIFEVGFLVSMWKSNWFRFWMIQAIVFHLSVYLFMGFTFTMNLVCYLIFVNWALVLYKLRLDSILERIFSKIKQWHAWLLVGLGIFLKWQFGKPYLFNHLHIDKGTLVLTVFGVAALLIIGSSLLYLKKKEANHN